MSHDYELHHDHEHGADRSTSTSHAGVDPLGKITRSAQLRAPESPEPSGFLQLRGVAPAKMDGSPEPEHADAEHAQEHGGEHDESVHRVAQAGLSGPSRTLPHLATIQASFGQHDVSGVRAHVGGAAANASAALGAEAFATGNSVAFRSEPDLFTAAHEAAHVVQQRQGVHLLGGVGRAGDAYEQHADAVAHAVVQGRSAEALLGTFAGGGASNASPVQRRESSQTSAPIVQRKETTFPQDGGPLGVKTSKKDWQDVKDQVPDPSKGNPFEHAGPSAKLDGLERGTAGFGAELGVAASNKAAAEVGKGTYGTFTPVAAYVETTQEAIHAQGAWIAEAIADIDKTEYTPNPVKFGKDPYWVTQDKKGSVIVAKQNISILERHQMEHWRWVNTFNDWCLIANSANTARADMVQAAGMLGYDVQTPQGLAKFVEGLESGLGMAHELVDAPLLGKGGDTSWSGRSRDHGAGSAFGPTLAPTPITPSLVAFGKAFDDVRLANFGMYENLLAIREEALTREKVANETKLAKLNGVIMFWTGMATTLTSYYGTAKGLASGATGAKFDRMAEDHFLRASANHDYDSAAKRAQEGKAAGLQRAEMERVNSARERMSTHTTDTPGAAGAGAPPPPPAISLETVVGGVLKLAFNDDLRELKGKITSLQTQLAGVVEARKLNDMARNMETYTTAVKSLHTTAETLNKALLANRQSQYRQMGDALDVYARTHHDKLRRDGKGHLAPKSDKHEIYSALMVTVAKVRAFLGLAKLAKGSFPYGKFAADVGRLDRERNGYGTPVERVPGTRSWAKWSIPKIPGWSAGESAMWKSINTQTVSAFQKNELAMIVFAGVEEKITGLAQKLQGDKAVAGGGDAGQNQY